MEHITTIFIIEDDPDLSQILKYNLEKEGYRAIPFTSGVDAFGDLAKGTRPNLIILDLMMSPPDGFDIYHVLKGTEEFRDIPIIILSAKAEREDIVEALATGVELYLAKPFEMGALLSHVHKLLGANLSARG